MTRGSATPDAVHPYEDVLVLVLGASGFIGRWVLRALAAQGARTHAVVHPGDPLAPAVEAVAGVAHRLDLERLGGLDDLMDDVRPAVVFNLAGYGVGPEEDDGKRAQALNVDLVERLVQERPDHHRPAWPGPRLVHAGSIAESGPPEELHPATPATRAAITYARTKRAGSDAAASAARRSPLAAVVARLFTVYGPGERPGRLLPSLLEAARTGAPIDLSEGAQRRDFTYVEDVAEGLLRLGAAAPPPGPVLDVATGRLTSVREFAERAAEVLGIRRSALRFGRRPDGRFDLRHPPADVANLERHLGWRPGVAIVEGVRRTRDWIEPGVREAMP